MKFDLTKDQKRILLIWVVDINIPSILREIMDDIIHQGYYTDQHRKILNNIREYWMGMKRNVK